MKLPVLAALLVYTGLALAQEARFKVYLNGTFGNEYAHLTQGTDFGFAVIGAVKATPGDEIFSYSAGNSVSASSGAPETDCTIYTYFGLENNSYVIEKYTYKTIASNKTDNNYLSIATPGSEEWIIGMYFCCHTPGMNKIEGEKRTVFIPRTPSTKFRIHSSVTWWFEITPEDSFSEITGKLGGI